MGNSAVLQEIHLTAPEGAGVGTSKEIDKNYIKKFVKNTLSFHSY